MPTITIARSTIPTCTKKQYVKVVRTHQPFVASTHDNVVSFLMGETVAGMGGVGAATLTTDDTFTVAIPRAAAVDANDAFAVD